MAEQAFAIMEDGPMDGRGQTYVRAIVVAPDYESGCKIAEEAGFKIDDRRYYMRDHLFLRAAS